jgi:sugar phosphate isomerase/epimerase
LHEIGIEATLDKIREMGITAIEGGPLPGRPDRFRRMCEERGISIPSTGTRYEQLVRNPEAVVARAKALGARYVMTAWIPHEVGHFNYEVARRAVADFNAAGHPRKGVGPKF